MESSDLLECAFSAWYDQFKAHTFKSRILEIPPDVLAYLNEDGIVLPKSSIGINSRADAEWDSDDDDLKEQWDNDDSASNAKTPNFTAFDALIQKAISALGGSVFPKLNWSAPKDAAWIALNNSLECKMPSDIYLLLKSSTFVAHDLAQQPFCKVQLHLVLRRWHKLDPAGEFRCFVKNQQIIGICQRHYTNFFKQIGQDQSDIIDEIIHFYTTIIRENFPKQNYVLDVYRKEKGKVYVVDFNPYCPITDALMFTWNEIDDINVDTVEAPQFRFVKTDYGITSSPYQGCALPQDMMDLTTGTDPEKLLSLLQLKIQKHGDDSSSEEDEMPSTTKSLDGN